MPPKPKRSRQRTRPKSTEKRRAPTLRAQAQPAQSVRTEKPRSTTVASHGRVIPAATGRQEWPTLRYFWPSMKMTAIIAGACVVLMIVLRLILG